MKLIENKITNNYCSRCKNDTRHSVIASEICVETKEIFFESLKGDSSYLIACNNWKLLRCLGCENLDVKIGELHLGPKDEMAKLTKEFLQEKVGVFRSFPSKAERIIPIWIFSLEKNYIELLAEIYSATNAGSVRLALMGMRTILDQYINETIGDVGTFAQKIATLASEGHISTAQEKLISVAIDAGNATAHRGFKPNKKIINAVLDIVEHLLKTRFLMLKTEEISLEIPKKKILNKKYE